jgi:hypothetical protein
MMERIAIWRGAFYEGNKGYVRPFHPAPVISPASCDFVSFKCPSDLIFREDFFDPATRIRRGRLYSGGKHAHTWGHVFADDHGRPSYDWSHPNSGPELTYEAWKPSVDSKSILDRIIHIGADEFKTRWRVVGVEKLSIGQILLTLRAKSQFGLLPSLPSTVMAQNNSSLQANKLSQVVATMENLGDTYNRFQPVPTVDAARESARVILAAWIGSTANAKDLGGVIDLIPDSKTLLRKAAFIVNRLHPRTKTAEQERQANNGKQVRDPTEEDAEMCLHLIALILREIGWADA